MKYTITILIFALFAVTGFSQELGYNIFGASGKPVSKEQLSEARSMIDINPEYPSSWIDEDDYVSSKVKTTNNGVITSAAGQNDILTEEQISVIKEVEIGSNIDIEVKYNVENSITNRVSTKTMKFTVSLIPEKEAEYQGGEDEMKSFLKFRAIDKMNAIGKNEIQMAKVGFIVDENGIATNARITQTSEDKIVDQLLIDTIEDMPNWIPAEDSNGKKVMQEFELVVGTMVGC